MMFKLANFFAVLNLTSYFFALEAYKPSENQRPSSCGFITRPVRRSPAYKRYNAKNLQRVRHCGSTRLQSAFVDTAVIGGLLGGLNRIIQEAPMASAFVTCGLKSSLADALAQKRELATDSDDGQKVGITKTKKQKMSFRRCFAFLIYGGVYLGMAQHYIYSHLFPSFFGSNVSAKTIATMVLFDVTVISTVLTLPIAYLIKAVIYKKTMKDGLSNYIHDCKHNGLWFKNFAVWAPAQSLTFSIVPLHLRATFIAFVSFFWLQLFSSICGKK